MNAEIVASAAPVYSVINQSTEYPIFECGGGVFFLETGSGAPSVLTPLYECASFPIESIVRVGACGGLSNVKVGQLILVDLSLCMDAVSKKLCGTKTVRSDDFLTSIFLSELSKAGFDCVVGSCASVNSMYLFESDVDKARNMGVTCWDLETSAVLAFGKKFGIPAAAVLCTVSNGGDESAYPPLPNTKFLKVLVRVLSSTHRKATGVSPSG
jgi:uridine phosphorylase